MLLGTVGHQSNTYCMCTWQSEDSKTGLPSCKAVMLRCVCQVGPAHADTCHVLCRSNTGSLVCDTFPPSLTK
jgi:hypothetical protein